MAKKKSNTLGGILGAVAVGVGVVAAALLSNKKNRAKVEKAVSSATKKAAPVVKKVAKKAEVVLKKEARSAAGVVKKSAAAKTVKKATKK